MIEHWNAAKLFNFLLPVGQTSVQICADMETFSVFYKHQRRNRKFNGRFGFRDIKLLIPTDGGSKARQWQQEKAFLLLLSESAQPPGVAWKQLLRVELKPNRRKIKFLRWNQQRLFLIPTNVACKNQNVTSNLPC